ncbi:MAG: virulence protein RhuM/Fic/DOC family protein [Candidatus Kerfeldbacteria bacterium]|nr:virulence protein RhuM/Fic/DOC family protein [Candidatus Kerfeldbacteria bacterium]
MSKKKGKGQIVIYQAQSGAIELRGDLKKETIWATQAQIASLFAIERSVATKHIRKILEDKELNSNSVCAKFAHTADDGKKYQVQYYNLDLILAVGYRTHSTRAIEFRKWATKILREYITKGYTINRKRIAQNYNAFMKAVADIQLLLPEHVTLDPKMILELIKEYAGTWVSLDAYDKESLKVVSTTKKSIRLTGEELTSAISTFRSELLKKGEAKEIFAQEREHGNTTGIVGNIMQSFAGKAVYPSIEEKAAHLLYFMVKNHPSTDGNKRCGAFAFIWFLRKFRAKGSRNINPASLTALTLLIAESDPKKKDQMVALITQLLQ